jgi:hypothetical protein
VERGIRTLEGGFPPYSLSRRAPSASSAISPNTFFKNLVLNCGAILLAEGVGFEPTEVLPSTVFKTAAFDHSAIPPQGSYFTNILQNKGQYLCRLYNTKEF